MGRRFGSDTLLEVAKETAWGTRAATKTFALELMGVSGGFSPGRTPLPVWRGRTTPGFMDIGQKTLKSYTVPIVYGGNDLLYRALFGGYAFASLVTPTRYKHTFTLSTVLPKSITMLDVHSDSGMGGAPTAVSPEMAGCYVRRMQLDFPAAEVPKVTVDVVGAKETLQSATSPLAYPAQSEWVIPGQYSCTIDTVSPPADLNEFSLTIENGMDEGRMKLRTGNSGLGQPDILDRAKVTGSFSLDYVNVDPFYTKFISGATFAMVFTITGTGGTQLYTISLPNCVMLGDYPNPSGPGLIQHSVNFEALAIGATAPITFEVTNLQSTDLT